MAGLFFCLASAEGAGFFCSAAIQPHTSVYSGFYSVHAVYTTHATKQRTGLYRGIFCDCTNSTASNTRLAQAAITSPATRWNTSQRRNTSSAYQIPAPRRTLHSSAQTAYYNNVYKGAEVPACYRSMPDGAAHRRPCQPGGAVQRRAARNYWRLSPQLFSGFRPIANRGQQ